MRRGAYINSLQFVCHAYQLVFASVSAPASHSFASTRQISGCVTAGIILRIAAAKKVPVSAIRQHAWAAAFGVPRLRRDDPDGA